MKTKHVKFRAKFTLNESFQKGGRKRDSNYYKNRIAKKKVAYIHHLVEQVEQLFIVSSLKQPPCRPGFIDRFLILSEDYHWKPVIIFTKKDLALASEVQAIQGLYEGLGYDTLSLSSVTLEESSTWIHKVRRLLKGRRSAIVGHSGVGKTTLLNHVDPMFNQKTQEISSYTQKGRHTTTRIFMYELRFGGIVYDMPGLKEVDFIHLSKRELSRYYHEFRAVEGTCRYADCLHCKETVCGVKSAVQEGKIHAIRYKNYLNILDDLSP